jgi:hypothetical protein
MNHYSRPGFGAWWLALAVSDVVATDVHWIMAGACTYPDRLRAHTITPAMRELFSRIAQVYGFTVMPPMPPDPRDWAERAMAVRRVIGHVRHSHQPVIGLAPEGGDSPEGTLQWPPSGTGRFVLHLAELGLKVVPVGGYESRGALCLRFGPAYRLEVSSARPARDRDQEVRETVMHHIAAQLPPHLRGRFA